MATANLWNTEKGALVDYELTVDASGEIIAEHEGDVLKFPAGLTKTQLKALFAEHNKANEGVVARDLTKVDEDLVKSQKLIDSL